MNNIYQENGYANRLAYLKSLAEDPVSFTTYAVRLNTVLMYAEMLGPEEDFDALVTYTKDGL